MGKLAPTGIDQANQVLFGTFTNSGVSAFIPLYGTFNIAIWGHQVATLTTTNGNTTASINTNTSLAAGQYVNSTNVPAGTTVGAVSTNTVNLNFAPGFTNGNVSTGVDSNATFGPASWQGTVQLERSFDGGSAFLQCGVGGAGQGAIYLGTNQGTTAVSITAAEPERGMLYRLNCISYTTGTIRWRMSASGLAAMAWGVPPG